MNMTINVLFCEETRPGQQAVPDYLYDGDDAGTKTEAEYPTNVGHQSGESAVDVLRYFLAVGLLEVDIEEGRVLPHVEQYFLLEQINPLLVSPQAALGPELLTGGGLHDRDDVSAEAGVSLLQRPSQGLVGAGQAVEFPGRSEGERR